ncbi:subtilisin-like protein [Colletotrichum eremochloae]|nr:subtilisin-like protein [Colletotrichum eremochloae]
MRNVDLLALCLVFSFGSRAVAHPNPKQAQEPRISDPASRPVSSIFASTGTTSSASAAAAQLPYVVFFAQDATAEDISAVNSTLNRDAAPNSLSEVTKSRTGLVVFFKATISASQADAIRRAPGVSGVFPDEIPEQEQPPTSDGQLSTSRDLSAPGPRGSFKRRITNPTDVSLQTDASKELKVISQPPGAALRKLPGYAYASEGGKGVTIYIVDSGVDVENPEWSRMPGSKSFIFSPGARHIENDPENHGTWVAAKAGGPVQGTAKNADMVAVKTPWNAGFSDIAGALIEISNDVYEKNLEGKAVINMSILHYDLFPGQDTIYKQLLVALMMEDIVIVAAAGNDARDKIKGKGIGHYPAVFGYSTNLIVVGAVTKWGFPTGYTQGLPHQVTVYAPGSVNCASEKCRWFTRALGTSFAAPSVAGVIAVWLSQEQHKARLQVKGKVAKNNNIGGSLVVRWPTRLSGLLAYHVRYVYPRIINGPPVIWNGIDPRRT